MSNPGFSLSTKFHASSSANFFEPRYAMTALVAGSIDSSYVRGFQSLPVYVKYGGAFRFASSTEAKEEVITTLLTELFAAASSIDRTPLMAGIMSSFSLSFVSYVNGCQISSINVFRCMLRGSAHTRDMNNCIYAFDSFFENSGLFKVADLDKV